MHFLYIGYISYLTFYVNTICLTPNSQYIFCWGIVKHSFIHLYVCMYLYNVDISNQTLGLIYCIRLYQVNVLTRRARYSSVVRAFAHGAIHRWIDPPW